jgi:hypothetical protein
MEKQEIKHNLIRFSEKEREIMRTIGGGNLSEGARICVMWGAHFWNLGLNTEMDLKHIGLVTVSTTDQHPHE